MNSVLLLLQPPVFFSAKVLSPTRLPARQGRARRGGSSASVWLVLPRSPHPLRPPAQPPPWSVRAPVPVTKHTAPSWDRAGRGEVGDLWSGDMGQEVPATAPSRDTPGSMPGVPGVAGRLLWVPSRCSVCSAFLTCLQHRLSLLRIALGWKQPQPQGKFAHPAFTPERSVVYPKLCKL